jgi:hypothetical protein
MSRRRLIFEDLVGNISILEATIKNIANLKSWDPEWSIVLNKSTEPEALAAIQIYVKIKERIFDREIIIFGAQEGFTIQWGFVPHPLFPTIYDWLKNLDTAAERTLQRNNKIKNELTKIVCHPANYFIEGL